MGKWSDIPLELIESVEEYLDFVDKVRIRAVCTSWNSYLHKVPKLISKELPWLLLEDSTKGALLYSIHEAKLYPLNLPELKHKIFKGSSYGWIITLEDESSSDIDEIYAFNPLTRVRIKLPPRSAFPDVKDFNPQGVGEEYTIKEHEVPEPGQYQVVDIGLSSKTRTNRFLTDKVVLSSSPESNDCMAVAIYGLFKQLAWCRPHHKKWTSFFNYSIRKPHNGVMDVVFHNGKLHALFGNAKLEIYESIDPKLIIRQVVAPHIDRPRKMMLVMPMYLAVCPSLGIYFITRILNVYDEGEVTVVDTDYIYKYKLVESSVSDGSKTWVEVDSLVDNILFLGLNMTTSIPVSDEFRALGYKRNCVYYTDHTGFFTPSEKQDDSDMGVFDLTDSFTIGLPGFKHVPELFWPPPIWVTPSAN